MALKDNIKQQRGTIGLTLEELAQKVGVSRQTIQRYESGIISNIPSDNIEKMAVALETTPAILMGWENKTLSIPQARNIFPIQTKRIPLISHIAPGEPIMAEQNFESYVGCGADVHADFCLRVEGDSMINARIYDGDIVFIRQQPDVENGQIAAVQIDDCATLKRVYKMPGMVQLQSENPRYKPMVFNEHNCTDFRILGKAVAFQGDVV